MGLEVVKAGKVAKTVTALALGEDEPVKGKLLEIAHGGQALQVAADNYAARIAVKQKILLQVYRPLARLMGVSKDYFENDFNVEIAQKTAWIPDEELITPLASIAIPAMQGLSYSLGEPNLKEMYLNLLAAATDRRRQSEAHPSFAEIIRQLSAVEIDALDLILKDNLHPIVQLRVRTLDSDSYQTFHEGLLNWVDPESKTPIERDLSAFLDNWVRLGLISITFAERLADPDLYEWSRFRPEYVKLAEHGDLLSAEPGMLRVTSFGRRFAQAVAPPTDPAPDW